ncbi:MAG: hypothetical protein ACRDSP_26410 [Pseudonocardiaceae bacterium]
MGAAAEDTVTAMANGHDNTRTGGVALPGSRPVVLLRARPGVISECARVVHLAPSVPDTAGLVSALCGELLHLAVHETVAPGTGMPCSGCVVSHAQHLTPDPTDADEDRAAPAPDLTDATPRNAGRAYRSWGWPVTVRRGQVWLALGGAVVAVLLPTVLAVEVTVLLAQRRCPPAVLVHPDASDHLVLLCGEPFDVTAPYPADVHRVTGTVLLPPTETPRGPLTWVHPPNAQALQTCREFDIVAAVRALREPPPASAPTVF